MVLTQNGNGGPCPEPRVPFHETNRTWRGLLERFDWVGASWAIVPGGWALPLCKQKQCQLVCQRAARAGHAQASKPLYIQKYRYISIYIYIYMYIYIQRWIKDPTFCVGSSSGNLWPMLIECLHGSAAWIQCFCASRNREILRIALAQVMGNRGPGIQGILQNAPGLPGCLWVLPGWVLLGVSWRDARLP